MTPLTHLINSLIELLEVELEFFKASLLRGVLSIVLLVVASVVAIIGFSYMLEAGHGLLAQSYGAPMASLFMGGAALLTALILVGIALWRR
ncbi:MAG: hypothetical protein KU37_06185 [Sulfuricurvum sp. PC08-66]|nr:MAG: hypothetical protein KU37_06185 [Sulfuricurvum sp. PC08-66]